MWNSRQGRITETKPISNCHGFGNACRAVYVFVRIQNKTRWSIALYVNYTPIRYTACWTKQDALLSKVVFLLFAPPSKPQPHYGCPSMLTSLLRGSLAVIPSSVTRGQVMMPNLHTLAWCLISASSSIKWDHTSACLLGLSGAGERGSHPQEAALGRCSEGMSKSWANDGWGAEQWGRFWAGPFGDIIPFHSTGQRFLCPSPAPDEEAKEYTGRRTWGPPAGKCFESGFKSRPGWWHFWSLVGILSFLVPPFSSLLLVLTHQGLSSCFHWALLPLSPRPTSVHPLLVSRVFQSTGSPFSSLRHSLGRSP